MQNAVAGRRSDILHRHLMRAVASYGEGLVDGFAVDVSELGGFAAEGVPDFWSAPLT